MSLLSSMQRTARFSLPCVCVLAFAVAKPAYALIENQVQVPTPGEGNGSKRETGPDFVQVLSNYGRAPSGENPGSAIENLANASAGVVGVRSSSAGSVASGSASATTTGTYTIIGPGTSAPISLNLDLSGALAVEGGERSPSAGASISLHYTFGGLSGRTYYAALSKGANESPAHLSLLGDVDNNPFAGTPVGSSMSWDTLYTTATVTLPVGRPLPVQLQLVATSSLGSGVSDAAAFGAAGSYFEHTVSLAQDGPVFNLPEGYTVTSDDFGIVDNRFVLSPVPEPSTYAMLAGGLLAIAGWRRRRRQPGT